MPFLSACRGKSLHVENLLKNNPGVLESAREAVYKEYPGRAAPEDAGVVELADARDSKSRVREDVRVQVPPPAPFKNAQLHLLRYRRGGCFDRL